MVVTGADDYIIKGHITRLGTAITTALERRLVLKSKKEAEENVHILLRVVEQNPVSIMLTDINGNIEYVNPKFSELTGYSKKDVLGKNARILKSGNQNSEEYKELWETIKSAKDWRGEFQNRKKNGEIYYESALIAPIIDGKGKITHFLAIKEDITDRKISEEIIRNYNLNLEKTVKERTAELERAKEQAEIGRQSQELFSA